MRNPLQTGQPKKAYKLRRKTDGLYANGGYYGGFGPEGKTWSTLKNLKSHLRMRYVGSSWRQDKIEDLEVVEGVFQPVGQAIMQAKDLFNNG